MDETGEIAGEQGQHRDVYNAQRNQKGLVGMPVKQSGNRKGVLSWQRLLLGVLVRVLQRGGNRSHIPFYTSRPVFNVTDFLKELKIK